ncbi:HAD-IIA family hydrolase [Roseovarius aestuariivivens]|uniref:HAD-IIA family hydrolase n=1 Tax=Roseovarius aestuariivivens TaxID=1888910 RepID=UPI001081CD7D|nr:HAD-IIA family hydrolase [Roseovarius aestuariivivens]
MTTMTAQEALAAYEAARHRLPDPVTATSAPRRVDTLAGLARDFDAFFLDAFGVLNVGETAIPGVPDRIAALQEMGKRVLVVSNAAGFPQDRLLEKYARLGYDFADDDVVTSRKALAAAVGAGTGRRWGLMVSDGMPAAEFDALDHVRLRDDAAAYETPDIFLMIGSATWTETRQTLLEEALIARPRPVFVGNPDIVAPREKGFSLEPGHFAHRLADRTGITPEFFGKPFANIYDIAFARLSADIPKSRILMVGDSLHTDILGAQTAGVASALVTDYGFLAGQDPAEAMAQTGITPDFILPSP